MKEDKCMGPIGNLGAKPIDAQAISARKWKSSATVYKICGLVVVRELTIASLFDIIYKLINKYNKGLKYDGYNNRDYNWNF